MGKHKKLHNRLYKSLIYIVLDCFVETVDFIDEQDGPLALRPPQFGLRDRLADFLDAGKHSQQGDELALKLRRHHPRQRRLADPRRPPEDHRMRLPGLESQAQRFAQPEQVLLADHLVRRLRAQLLGQRRMGRNATVSRKFCRILRKQIAHRRYPQARENTSSSAATTLSPSSTSEPTFGPSASSDTETISSGLSTTRRPSTVKDGLTGELGKSTAPASRSPATSGTTTRRRRASKAADWTTTT